MSAECLVIDMTLGSINLLVSCFVEMQHAYHRSGDFLCLSHYSSLSYDISREVREAEVRFLGDCRSHRMNI